MNKTISILTACYNNATFLPTLTKSVLSQDVHDWEWIIVDDHSTDGSWDYLSNLNHKKVKVLRNSDRIYCSSTYAKALSEASGDFCGILDADDALTTDAVKTLLRRYEAHSGLSYIYTQHSWCNVDLKRRGRGLSSLPPNGLSIAEAAIKKKHCFSHWRTFRRSIVDNVDFIFPPGLQVAVDKHMGFALEELGFGGFFPRELYLYRYYKGNMSLSRASDQRHKWQELARECISRRQIMGIQPYPIKVIK